MDFQKGVDGMPEEKVGKIVKFFAKPSVAAIEITDGTLEVGNKIKIKGHTTDFEDTVTSMQEENQSIEKASPGQMIGIKVKERVREHDIIYKITD
jgi:putative protease